jgi:hypothetical protein
MRASTSALLSSILVAVPVTFASITIVHVGSDGYLDAFTQPGLWVMVVEGFVWYAVCGLLSNFLVMRFAVARSTPKIRSLVHVVIGAVLVSVPLAYISTTLYQSIASGTFSSVGTYPHSWVFYLRALRWYLLCGLLASVLAQLLMIRGGTQNPG